MNSSEDLKSDLKPDFESKHKQDESVAVVGMSCRFAGVDTLMDFQDLLAAGRRNVSTVPAERTRSMSFDGSERGSYLKDVFAFDPDFFKISEAEVRSMDPQQRLMLELAWEALEDALIVPSTLARKPVAVYLGAATLDHARLHLGGATPEHLTPYSATGSSLSIIAARLAYFFNFRGPCMSVDTACSSSLTAIHLARRSILSGEAEVALAGGVNLVLDPVIDRVYGVSGLKSNRGVCSPFDATADGIVRGEGGGLLVLKKLSQARADGDSIYALLRGSGIGQDGRSAVLTAPNGPAQSELLRAVYEQAGLDPARVGYVETHGTGTPLGDPIEAGALGEVLGRAPGRGEPLRIGSVKSNLGHTEAAAGVASTIKAILMLRQGRIYPNAGFESSNPHVDFSESGLRVAAREERWRRPGKDIPRFAGVSSFGFGGSNAHLILEEVPEAPVNEKPNSPPALLLLSAHNRAALRDLAERYHERIAADPASLYDLCAGAVRGREVLAHRLALCADSSEEIQNGLLDFTRDRPATGLRQAEVRNARRAGLTFVFSGQGPPITDCIDGLPLDENVFQESLEEFDHLLLNAAGWSLLELIQSADPALNQQSRSQPALVCLQISIARLWRSRGFDPTAVLGHSVGEIAAACFAEILTPVDAVRLALHRGGLMERYGRGGGMLLLGLEIQQLAEFFVGIPGQLSLAAHNDESSLVISGERAAIDFAYERAIERGLYARPIKGVQAGAHSPMMESAASELRRLVADLKPAAGRLNFYSTVTGAKTAGVELSGDYWARNLREPVLFGTTMQALAVEVPGVFLEVAPNPVLQYSLERNLEESRTRSRKPLHHAYTLRPGRPGSLALRDSIGEFFCLGVPTNLAAVFPFAAGHGRLPGYPFQRRAIVPDWSNQQHGSAADSAEIRRIAREESQRLPYDLSMNEYAATVQELEPLAVAAMCTSLRELGLFNTADAVHSSGGAVAAGIVNAEYTGLLERWFSHLNGRGILEAAPGAGAYRAPAGLPDDAPESILKRIEGAAPDSPWTGYLRNTLERLVPILRGEMSALESLFPDGSFALADGLYREWSVARYFNDMIARVLEVLASRTGRPLRILEIGAGTGGTTARVLPGLKAFRPEYHFTDLSDVFFRRARVDFADYDFVRYQLLDLEREPDEQGFAAGSFDAIVATNVLHAVEDLEGAVSRVRRLLRPGGVLLLNEMTAYRVWFDVTTALIEGWRQFDDELRGRVPLLEPSAWSRLLGRYFEGVEVLPGADSSLDVFGQHVLIGFSAEAANKGANKATHVDASRARGIAQTTTEAEDLEKQNLSGQDKAAYIRRKIEAVLPGRDLKDDVPLSFYGFDSLAALELLNQLRKELGQDLKLRRFAGSPSLRDVLALLMVDTDPVDDAKAEPHAGAAPAGGSVSSRRDIVCLQTGTDATSRPLFLIHPGGLDLSAYRQFQMALGARRTLFVLTPPEIDFYDSRQGESRLSIEDGARRCAEILQEQFANASGEESSDWELGGWSFGGVLAWETVRLLSQTGNAPTSLYLFDAIRAPLGGTEEIDHWFRAFLEFRFDVDLSGVRDLAEIRETMIAAGALSTNTPRGELERFLKTYRRGVESCLGRVREYQPAAIEVPVTLFSGAENISDGELQQLPPFARVFSDPIFAAAGLEVRSIPGNHYSLWSEPGARAMAAEITDRAQFKRPPALL